MPTWPNLKGAAKTLVNSLVGTPSTMSLFTFATSSPAAGTTNINRPALIPVSTTAGATAVDTLIDAWALPGGQDGGTNWDRGVRQVAQQTQQYDIVVVITDGNPTFYGDPGRARATEPGSARWRTASSRPTRSRPRAPGCSPSASAPVSAARRTTCAPSPGTIAGSDYYQTADYTAAGTALRALALGSCSGTVTVVKQVLPPGTPANSQAGAVPAGGWTFAASGRRVA